jgi:four helix bundle protein
MKGASSLLRMTEHESFQHRRFRFALEILRFYRRVTSTTDMPLHLARQALRAGTSIGANLEEARSAYSRRDLAAKQTITLREAREFGYWIRLIAADQPRQLPDSAGAR